MDQASARVADPVRRVEAIVAPSLGAMGYELVRVLMTGGHHPTLQIMAEPADGRAMTIEDCAEISRTVSALLDVEDPLPHTCTLEVSSPGIDRPLVRPKDYERFAGFEARIETAAPIAGRRRFRGTVLGMAGDFVRMKPVDGAGADPALRDAIEIPLSAVLRAKLILTDRLIAAHNNSPTQ